MKAKAIRRDAMTIKPTVTGSTNRRSRRQRIAIGAVLASTTLLGTYMAAVRPQPTYASPHKGGAGQGHGDATESHRAIAAFVRPACQVTVDDSTALQQAILNSVDDSVICIDGTITLTQPLPSIDDTRLTLRGLSGNSLDDSIVVNRDDSVAVSSILRGTSTTTDDTLTIADLGLAGGLATLLNSGGIPNWGGAISLQGTGVSGRGKLVLHDSTFTHNSAPLSGPEGRGGAAAVKQGDVYAYGSSFSANVARAGGALVVYGNVTVDDGSRFAGNAATNGSGGAVFVDGDPLSGVSGSRTRIADSSFAGNRSYGAGAGVYITGARNDIQISNSHFSGNATSLGNYGYGGSLYVATSRSGADVNVTIEGESTFTGNSAYSGGGLVLLGGGTGSLNLNVDGHATFVGNHATGSDGSGGAIFVGGSPLPTVSTSITGATFADDTAAIDGGAIFIKRGSLTLSDVTLEHNAAGESGGAIAALDDSVTATNTSVIDNTAYTLYGGGIFAAGAVTLTNSYVGGNDGYLGGAVFGGGDVLLDFSTVYDNSSFDPGAPTQAIYAVGSLTAVGSLVGNPQDDTVVTAASVDDTFSVSTGLSPIFEHASSQLVSASALALGARDGTGPGRQGRTPGAGSALVTGAPDSGLNTGVTLDQLGVVRAGTWTIGSRQYAAPPPPPPVFPPTPPTNVTAAPADRSALVSWAAPASVGSFPVSTYKAMASPGGQSCLVVSPALACTVTRLANGTPYTFTVQALSGAGWSPASDPSNVVRPGGDTPAPDPQPLPRPLAPGEALLQVNGVPDPNVTVDPNSQSTGLAIVGDGWSMGLDGLGPDGKPLNLGPDGSLKLQSERDVVTEGTGFLPNSEVDLYMDPPVLVTGSPARAATEAVYVGTVRTDASGKFAGTASLPDDITPGDHVLQAAGYSPSRQARAMSLGIVVDPSLVLDEGTRRADGRHDQIRTTGSSTGIDAGTRLTPWIRFNGQASFTQGRATITVQSDGAFRWTRQIRKDKGITAYVTYVDSKSNDVFWAKVR